MSEMVVLSDRAQALYQKIKTEQRGVVRASVHVDNYQGGSPAMSGTDQTMSGFDLPRYQVREQTEGRQFFKRVSRGSIRSTYARDEQASYLGSVIVRALLLIVVTVGAYYGNAFILLPETQRFEKLYNDGRQAEKKVPALNQNIQKTKDTLKEARTQLAQSIELFSSREFFRVRISEFFFELESGGSSIQRLCIGRLEAGKSLDPCRSPSSPADAPESIYAALFKASEGELRLQEIAGVEGALGKVGVDGVAVEILGDSQSYLKARQALVTDIPAIVLLEEAINYSDDSNREEIRLVFSYPYSGD